MPAAMVVASIQPAAIRPYASQAWSPCGMNSCSCPKSMTGNSRSSV